ncbi:MAG: DUF790 family protein [Gemmatimonadaceae bacterium]
MLARPQVLPFVVERDGELHATLLADDSAALTQFLDRLCRLVRRLEGRPRRVVAEALARQERRVRDARRLAGISKVLLDRCELRAPAAAERAPAVRQALFRARGSVWPPVPGDRAVPYEMAAAALATRPAEIERLLYADSPRERVLVRAPAMDGRALLESYNMELARGVLLDADRATLTARGGWRAIFRAVKLARLMYRLERAERSYRVELTGPAAPFIVRPHRYGVRFARVLPALMRAPGWRLDASIVRDGSDLRASYVLDSGVIASKPPRRASYDSKWEHALASDFSELLVEERAGWRLLREATPVSVAGDLFLPDFTLRHSGGREAMVEIIGFWTPEYLETKMRKIAEAGLTNLILVVYRGLAVGSGNQMIELASTGPVLWFGDRPRIGPVLQAAATVARVPRSRC